MTATVRLTTLALLITLIAACADKASQQSAVHIYTNANIYTVNAAQNRAEEVGVMDKKIVCVGELGACDAFRSSATKVHDLAGRFVVPGFIDSHNHISYSMGSKFLSLMNVASYEDFRSAVENFSDENPELDWVMGDGWNYSIFDGGMPTAKDLDGITKGRPAIFTSYDAHTQLLNTRGMELFGITPASKRSPLGEIMRDEKGEPTGIFKAAIYISEADQAIEAGAG